MTLLFATFQPARLHNDRFVQNLYSYAILFKRGQTEPLYSNISYWLLRVKFQMHNGCSLQMLNGNDRDAFRLDLTSVALRNVALFTLIWVKKKKKQKQQRLVFF